MRHTAISVVTVAAALSFSLHGSAQTTLSLSSNLVQIGVVVSDSKGPVHGLKAEDFIVLDNGKPRKVGLLLEQFGGAAQAQTVLAKNTFSNAVPTTDGTTEDQTHTTGTPTIILLDSLNSLYGSAPESYEETPTWTEDLAAANAKLRLIAALKEMDLRNPVAAYGLGATFRMLCDFTCSREELLDAVKRYNPADKTDRETAEPGIVTIPGQEGFSAAINRDNTRLAAEQNGKRGRDTMGALQTIAARVSAIPGRKNLLWLTSNLPYSGEAIARIATPAKIAIYPVDGRGLLTWNFGSAQFGGNGLPMSMASTSQPVGIEAMQEMAADTGGVAFVNTNDLVGAFHSVIDDRSVTYTLGFYVDSASVDGKFHNLKIRVNTPDANLRYARGYFAAKSQAGVTKQVVLNSPVAQPATAVNGPALLAAAINSPFAATAMPLDVKLEREADHKFRLNGVVGVQALLLRRNGSTQRGMIVVYIAEQNSVGDVLKQSVHQMQLTLTDQQLADYEKSGVLFTEAIEPQPQSTTLRVIVRDGTSSRLGSVIIPLAKVKQTRPN